MIIHWLTTAPNPKYIRKTCAAVSVDGDSTLCSLTTTSSSRQLVVDRRYVVCDLAPGGV